MNILLIDNRSSPKGGRPYLPKALRDLKHELAVCSQIDGSADDELHVALPDCAQSVAKLFSPREPDIVLLHVGHSQQCSADFLAIVPTSVPVVCYSGDRKVQPAVREHCNKVGLHCLMGHGWRAHYESLEELTGSPEWIALAGFLLAVEALGENVKAKAQEMSEAKATLERFDERLERHLEALYQLLAEALTQPAKDRESAIAELTASRDEWLGGLRQ